MLNLDILFKFIKFGLVGVSGMGIDFGITWIAKEKIRLNKYLANGLGFCIAATTNYLLNRWWTFQSTNPEIMGEYTKFFIVSLIGLGINTLALYLLINKLGMRFYLAKLGAIGVVFLWNFFANLLYTFV